MFLVLLVIIMIFVYGDIWVVVEVVKKGVYDYIIKFFDLDELIFLI